VLRVVAVAARRDGAGHLTEDDVLAFLANSLAAHQHRTIAAADPFPPATVSSTLAELVSADLLTSGPSGLALTELGTYVAQSGLRVSSAVRVARALRTLHPLHLNRATLITAAQLTDELDETQLRVNGRGWQSEQRTFFSELRRHRAAERMLAALPVPHDRTVGIARAKRAVACLLWTGGVAIGQLEGLLMKHLPGNDAAGSTRAVAARTQDVIGAVIEIARCLHPNAELDHLARLSSLMPTSQSLPASAPAAAPIAAPSSGTRNNSPNSSPQKAPPSAPAPARFASWRVFGFFALPATSRWRRRGR
jgi:helicase